MGADIAPSMEETNGAVLLGKGRHGVKSVL